MPRSVPSSDEEPLDTQLVSVVSSGRRVLVVGSPPGTFEDKYLRNPYLTFWPSTEHSAKDAARTVPAEVGAVLMTTMLSHDLSRNVRQQAVDRGLVYPVDVMSPGKVRRALALVMEMGTRSKEEAHMAQPKVASFQQKPQPLQLEPVEQPQLPQPEITQLIDDVIAGLQLIREQAVGLAGEIEAARAQTDKVRLLRELLK